jgi:hypothetical protein
MWLEYSSLYVNIHPQVSRELQMAAHALGLSPYGPWFYVDPSNTLE